MSDGGFFIRNESLFPYSIAISLKGSGDMSYKKESNTANRDQFYRNINLKGRKPVRNVQVHSDRILKAYDGMNEEADGIITDDASYAPFILTADCYNVFFTTSAGSEFGVVHAGWKGIAGGIAEALGGRLKGESKCIIAQGICAGHFTVEEDVMRIFSKRYGDDYIERHENGSFSIDLRRIVNDVLAESSQVMHIEMCNVCEREKLYSYRCGNADERNLSIIWRSDEI